MCKIISNLIRSNGFGEIFCILYFLMKVNSYIMMKCIWMELIFKGLND